MTSSPAASEAEVSEAASSPDVESSVAQLAAATAVPPILPSIELPNRNAGHGGTANDAPCDPKHDSASRMGDKPEDDSEDSSEDEDEGADAYEEEEDDEYEDEEDGVDGWPPTARPKVAKGKEPARKARGLEIRITPLPAHLRDGYRVAPRSTYVRAIVNEIEGARGEEWYQIEYDDGAVDQVSPEFQYSCDALPSSVTSVVSPTAYIKAPSWWLVSRPVHQRLGCQGSSPSLFLPFLIPLERILNPQPPTVFRG